MPYNADSLRRFWVSSQSKQTANELTPSKLESVEKMLNKIEKHHHLRLLGWIKYSANNENAMQRVY